MVKHYNLDAIISVGYRVNSRKGTQFRVWANQILKKYLLQGYALNEVRLKQQSESIEKLKKSLALIQRAQVESLEQNKAKGLLTALTEYRRAVRIRVQIGHFTFKTGL